MAISSTNQNIDLAAILDFKHFTNAFNTYTNLEYVIGNILDGVICTLEEL